MSLGSSRLLIRAILCSLAAAAPLVAQSGRLMDESGRPVAGGRVVLLPPYGIDDEHQAPWLPESISDGEGRFHLAGLAPAVMETAPYSALRLPAIAVLARGFAPCLRLEAIGDDVGDIVLRPGGRITGAVVDADGQPVPGADVRLVRTAGPLEVSWPEWYAWDPLLRVRTEADGRFEFPSAPIEPLRVEVSARAHRPAKSGTLHALTGGVIDAGTLRLGRGRGIAGRVLDADGEPAAGAHVYAVDTPLDVPAAEQDGVGLALLELVDRAQAVTDGSGRFVVMGLGGVVATLYAEAPGCEPMRLDHVAIGRQDVDMRLARQARLIVQVVDAASGQPLPSAQLLATRMLSTQTSGPLRRRLPVTSLDPEEALWEVGQAGPWGTWIQVTCSRQAMQVVEAQGLHAGEHALVTVRMKPGGDIDGLATLPDGRPAAGARIEVLDVAAMLSNRSETLSRFDAGSGVRGDGRAEVTADAEGRFRIEGVRPAVWSLSSTAPDGSVASDTVAVGPGEQAKVVLRHKLAASPEAAGVATAPAPKPTFVEGTVLSGDEPVVGAVIWLTSSGSHPFIRAVDVGDLDASDALDDRPDGTLVIAHADAAGHFRADVPDGGAWMLGAASPSGGLVDARSINFTPGEHLARDVLFGTNAIEVVVLDDVRGEPIEGAWVWLRRGVPPRAAPSVWRTDAEGRCMLRAFEPGTYEVVVCSDVSFGRDRDEPPSREPRVRQHAKLEGQHQTARVEIRLPLRVTLQGRVTTSEGFPVADGTVVSACERDGLPPILHCETEGGRYRLVGLDEGAWHVFVTEVSEIGFAPGSVLAESRLQVEAGQELDVDFVVGERQQPAPRERPLSRAEYFRPRSFDSAAWKDTDQVYQGVRIRMIDSLLRTHELIGLDREQVTELLGPPGEHDGTTWTWYLGDERGLFSIDSEWLSLTFDADGHVASHDIWTD